MKKRKTISTIVTAVTLAILVASCAHTQKYAYVSDAPRNEEMAIANNYPTTIFPGDQLYIYVYSQNQTAVKPFNEETRDIVSKSDNKPIKGYFVDDDGYIEYPILGAISTKGLTLDGLAREIEARMVEGRYVKDPMVTVSLMNFRVTVIGEIKQPQLLHGSGNRMTIFEAIAQCGDVTMDGIRTNVKVIRTNGNTQTIDSVDLTSKTVLDSPCYYLHSGDIVYIEPTPRKKRIAWRDEDWPRYLQIGTQAVRLAYVTVRYYYIMNR
ncbi:MAG: polysaccharide biosynthesis/export family protein [Bacteroidales bacterium]|nr:polysaccharide biosynthesis/export family protein [Bacteroidales bacterium]